MTLRIAVAAWALPTGPSGAARRLRGILAALPPLLARDEEVVVLHAADRACAWIRPPLRAHAVPFPAAPTTRRVLAEQRGLARELRRIGADVLELGTLPVPRALPARVALTVHDLRDLERATRRHPAWLARTALRSAARRTAAIVVPSAFTADRLTAVLRGGGPVPRVVPGAVGDAFLDLAPHPPEGRPFFLHVGHLERRKNLALLLAAYARFRDGARRHGRPCPALVLAGRDAGQGQALRRSVRRLGIAADVEVRGVVDEATLLALYAETHALLMPSLHEGFGLPALEALAVGVPAAVSDRGALPEVAGDQGLVLPARDVEAWSAALARLAERDVSDAAVAARKARARAFTWHAAAHATLAVWRALAP